MKFQENSVIFVHRDTFENVFNIPAALFRYYTARMSLSHFSDPAHYDSGLYECRTTMVNSDDYTSEGAVSTSRADIRIIGRAIPYFINHTLFH